MIIPRNGILELVGLPITELSKPIEKRQPYTIQFFKLQRGSNQKSLKFYQKRLTTGVLRKIVVETQTPPVCRFIYDNEDPKEVKAQWLRIKYI